MMMRSRLQRNWVSLVCLLALTLSFGVMAQTSTSGANKKKSNSSATTATTKATQPDASSTADGSQTAKKSASSADQEVDGIVAIVNKDVITQKELDIKVNEAKAELARQKIQLPPNDLLAAQVLQRMINDRLIAQEAARFKIVVTDQNVQQAVDAIAQRNKMTVPQLRKQIEATGMTWSDYQVSLRKEVMLDRVRQRVSESNMLISDAEVDAFLREQSARQSGGLASLGRPGATPPGAPDAGPGAGGAPDQPLMIALAQILVRVPEGASTDEVAAKRKRAEDILSKLKSGQSFESLAAGMSDGAESMRGGQLGARPIEGWPDLFVNAVKNLKDGQISGIVQSANGFHILKVLARSDAAPPPGAQAKANRRAAPQQQQQPPAPQGGPAGAPVIGAKQGPMPVQQTKARHILIKTTPVVTDDIALQRLKDIRDRIVEGKESFSDLAKRFSNDTSAPQGGDLGWLNPGETVPPFDRAMNALAIGEISQPVQTQFGWHLITVDDRRTEDMAEQFRRNQVRQYLFQKRADAAFEDWVAQVRNQSYIDNRFEKRLKQQVAE